MSSPRSIVEVFVEHFLFIWFYIYIFITFQGFFLIFVNGEGSIKQEYFLFVFRLTGIFVRYEVQPRKRKPFVLMSCVQSRTEAIQILSYVMVKFFQRLFGSCRVCTDSFLSGTRAVIGNTSGCRHGHEVLSETPRLFVLCVRRFVGNIFCNFSCSNPPKQR